MSRMDNQAGDGHQRHTHQHYVKQEAVAFGYDASYLNYTTGTATAPTTLNQPLPGQPPLPPMPPPQASIPPPPSMFTPVPPPHIQPWGAAWPWGFPQPPQPQLAQQSNRDFQYPYKKDMSGKHNFVKRDRFNNNRNNVYQHRGGVSQRKNNRRIQPQRFDLNQTTFEQAAYFGIAGPMSSSDIFEQIIAASKLGNSVKQENSREQDKKEETGAQKKNKPRKPMSLSYPSRPWNKEDAERAIRVENENTRTLGGQSLIIKFPDPELNKDVVRGFHPGIQNIHFQSPSGARYCFVQMKEGTNVEEAIAEIEKIRFGNGYLKAEKKSMKDEEITAPQEIDPYTLYIGNLPEALNVNEVKKRFPTAVRVDVGFAQKMRNTRYAFIRYNTVEESISAYKSSHSLMWNGRSVIVRFRRQRGNGSLIDTKTNPKIKNETAKSADNNTESTEINKKQLSSVEENEHIIPAAPECANNGSPNLDKSLTPENNQDSQSQSTSSQESPVPDSDFLTEIKEEPIDYEESNVVLIEEDDEDDEGELCNDHFNYMHYDDDDSNGKSPYKDLVSDKSSDEEIPDNLDRVFKDLVNTACDISVHNN